MNLMIDNSIQRYFQVHAPNWDARMPLNYAAILYDFAAPFIAEFQAASIILEIGTGTGSLIPVLKALTPDSTIVSADFAYTMVVQAQRRSPDARLLQADVHDLPLISTAFDLVSCHNSFPHFSDKPRALREVKRVLRPGGKLMILHNNSREFVNTIHKRAGPPIDRDLVPTEEEMRHLLISTDWTAIEIKDLPSHYIAKGLRCL